MNLFKTLKQYFHFLDNLKTIHSLKITPELSQVEIIEKLRANPSLIQMVINTPSANSTQPVTSPLVASAPVTSPLVASAQMNSIQPVTSPLVASAQINSNASANHDNQPVASPAVESSEVISNVELLTNNDITVTSTNFSESIINLLSQNDVSILSKAGSLNEVEFNTRVKLNDLAVSLLLNLNR